MGLPLALLVFSIVSAICLGTMLMLLYVRKHVLLGLPRSSPNISEPIFSVTLKNGHFGVVETTVRQPHSTNRKSACIP